MAHYYDMFYFKVQYGVFYGGACRVIGSVAGVIRWDKARYIAGNEHFARFRLHYDIGYNSGITAGYYQRLRILSEMQVMKELLS